MNIRKVIKVISMSLLPAIFLLGCEVSITDSNQSTDKKDATKEINVTQKQTSKLNVSNDQAEDRENVPEDQAESQLTQEEMMLITLEELKQTGQRDVDYELGVTKQQVLGWLGPSQSQDPDLLQYGTRSFKLDDSDTVVEMIITDPMNAKISQQLVEQVFGQPETSEQSMGGRVSKSYLVDEGKIVITFNWDNEMKEEGNGVKSEHLESIQISYNEYNEEGW